MIDYFGTVLTSLNSFTTEQLDKIIEAAKRKKEKIETDKKRAAATDLVKAFNAYKEATGKDTIKLYDCSGWNSIGPARTDVIVNIDQLFVDDNGDICHNIIF